MRTSQPGTAPDAPPNGCILVVDDNEQIRHLLREYLEAAGHEVAEAADGAAALALVPSWSPDVVLLDVQMPGLDGFEVCRRLKADPVSAAVPVLMVTALTSREDRLTGIRAGASDFITKPIDSAELLQRVSNSVRMHRMYRELRGQYRRLEELESLRDTLVHMVAHDLRTPLTAVRANLDLLAMDLDAAGGETAIAIADATEGTERVIEMVSDMLDVSRLEAGQCPLDLEPIDLRDLAGDVVRHFGRAASRIRYARPAEGVIARVDRGMVSRVLTNLLDNALRHSGEAPVVLVVRDGGEAGVRIEVADEGPGVPEESREAIFGKFWQARADTRGQRTSGLGLTFCKLAVEAHGGHIGVEGNDAKGSTFWVTLPV